MSIHIAAAPGAIAPVVLLPGDPLRAEHIAATFLKDVERYNTVRNMFGFTGTADVPGIGTVRVSVQGSGMGMPSLSIYVNELFDAYGVRSIIRVGTCGALRDDLHTKDIVIAAGACSDSGINRRRFRDMNFAPIADFGLLRGAVETAERAGIPVRVGNILAADLFYNDYDADEWKLWAQYGVLAVEMESAELYTVAARKGGRALSVLTVSDVLPTGAQISAQERQTSVNETVRIALGAAFGTRI